MNGRDEITNSGIDAFSERCVILKGLVDNSVIDSIRRHVGAVCDLYFRETRRVGDCGSDLWDSQVC